jgi:hypothetical protein
MNNDTTLLLASFAVLAIGLSSCGQYKSTTTTAEDPNKAAVSAAHAAARTAEDAAGSVVLSSISKRQPLPLIQIKP